MPVIYNYPQATRPGESGPQPWGGFIYNKKTPSWDQIRNTMPYSVQSPFYRRPEFGSVQATPTVGLPAQDQGPAAAFNGGQYDNMNSYIASLFGQISNQPQTTGWFDLPLRGTSLFGSSY